MPVPFPDRPPPVDPTTVEPATTSIATTVDMEPYSRRPNLGPPSSATLLADPLIEVGQSPSEARTTTAPVNNIPLDVAHINTPQLRSQAEFFMSGIIPIPAQPDVACSICLALLTDDTVKMVKCGHMFHCTCIAPWFQSRNSRRGACPNCRTELFEPAPLTAPHVPLTPPIYTPRGGVERGELVVLPESELLPRPSPGASVANALHRSHRASSRPGDPRAIAQQRRAELSRATNARRHTHSNTSNQSDLPERPTALLRYALDSILHMYEDVQAQMHTNMAAALGQQAPSTEADEELEDRLRNTRAREVILRARSERPRPVGPRDRSGQTARFNTSRLPSLPPTSREFLASVPTETRASFLQQIGTAESLRQRYDVEVAAHREASAPRQQSADDVEPVRPAESISGSSSAVLTWAELRTRQARRHEERMAMLQARRAQTFPLPRHVTE